MTNTAEKYNESIRNIIEIDEDLCDGCGQCLGGCAEGALALVDGRARLVSDIYCDGLGACLGHCPTGALKVIQRRASDFDEEAALARVLEMEKAPKTKNGCPGSKVMTLAPPAQPAAGKAPVDEKTPGLAFWPIQLKLAPPEAPAFDNQVLVLAADCSAFTGPAFHQVFLTEGHPLVMACPKLDEVEPYIEKMTAILKAHQAIREIRVPMMSVPCCGGLGYIATQALKRAGREGQVKLRTWIVTPQGQVTEEILR